MGRFESGLSEWWVTVLAVLHRTTAGSTPVVGHDGVTGTISAPPRKISRDLRLYSRIRKVLIPCLVSVLGLAIADVLLCSGIMIITIASYVHYIKILLG